MTREELLKKLEELNTTLGAVSDAVMEAGDKDASDSLNKLRVVSDEYREMLLDEDRIGRVMRVNRELREQLGMIRDIVVDSEDKT